MNILEKLEFLFEKDYQRNITYNKIKNLIFEEKLHNCNFN